MERTFPQDCVDAVKEAFINAGLDVCDNVNRVALKAAVNVGIELYEQGMKDAANIIRDCDMNGSESFGEIARILDVRL